MLQPFASPETIAAIATAPGRGGIGIVRVAGPEALRIAQAVTGKQATPRLASFASFRDHDGAIIDSGIVIHFSAPSSFTGDDVVEFQGHGGPVVLDMILERVISLGARIARPGEFSERAYLNGKIDLAQAEAIADLIDSSSREAARGASRSLQGEFSDLVNALVEEVTRLRIFVEACIDFPEEEIDILADPDVQQRIEDILSRITHIESAAKTGRLLREGMNILLAGKPNAGKSSLLNSLSGNNVAIVSAIPGTTRDLIRERILIDGMPVHITDTAGLRDSPDEIEREGIRRALQEAENTDLLLLVVDSSTEDDPETILRDHFSGFAERMPPVCIVMNKCDLGKTAAGLQIMPGAQRVGISAMTGTGIDALREVLRNIVGYAPVEGGNFSARRRHLDALTRARQALLTSHDVLLSRAGPELLAEDLRAAQQHLGEITGHLSSDELLGKIFSSFCIGK